MKRVHTPTQTSPKVGLETHGIPLIPEVEDENSAKSLQRMQITKVRRDMGKGIYLGGRPENHSVKHALTPQIPKLNIKHCKMLQNVEVDG